MQKSHMYYSETLMPKSIPDCHCPVNRQRWELRFHGSYIGTLIMYTYKLLSSCPYMCALTHPCTCVRDWLISYLIRH